MADRSVEVVVEWRKEDGAWHEFPFDGEARYYASWYHVYLTGDLSKTNRSYVYSHYRILRDDKFRITEAQLSALEGGASIIIERQGELHVRPKTESDKPRETWWISWWQYFTNSDDRPTCSC